MSILGVTLVLFLLGIIGWSVINAKKLRDYFKENIEVRTYLRGNPEPQRQRGPDELYLLQALCKKH